MRERIGLSVHATWGTSNLFLLNYCIIVKNLTAVEGSDVGGFPIWPLLFDLSTFSSTATNMTALQTSIAAHNRRLVEFGNRVFDPADRDRERT